MLTGKRYYYPTESLRDRMAKFFIDEGYSVRKAYDDKAYECAKYAILIGKKKNRKE